MIRHANAYRSDRIPKPQTNSLSVLTARLSLPQTVGATVRTGTWLNGVTSRYPAAVLGADAADRLGIGRPNPQTEILVGGERFTVIGVLNPVPLAQELDSAVLIGWDVAVDRFRFDGRATTVYTRSRDSQVEAVRAVLAATANPAAPGDVEVSKPSDLLAARRAVNATLNGLLLGLGAVALLVGGVSAGFCSESPSPPGTPSTRPGRPPFPPGRRRERWRPLCSSAGRRVSTRQSAPPGWLRPMHWPHPDAAHDAIRRLEEPTAPDRRGEWTA